MANVIVHHLRRQEAESESGGGSDQQQQQGQGLRRGQVVTWYLTEVATDIDSQEELAERKQIVEKVLDRLAYQDNVLLPLSRIGLKGDQKGDEYADDPVLVVHPNYVIDA